MSSIDSLLYSDDLWFSTRDAFMGKWSISMQDAIDIELMCNTLRQELLTKVESRSYEWGIPRKIYVSKMGTSKKRIVYLFELEQRVLLGVLYRVLSCYFKDRISSSCFSYKKGVNTLKAVEHLRNANKDCSMYGVKLDISAYFNSVSKGRLNEMIEELFFDKKDTNIYHLIKSLYSIEHVYDKGKLKNEYMSLIAGTAIASFFANYCLRNLDNYFETRGIPYARYSDDIIIFGQTEEETKEHLEVVRNELNKFGLSVNPRKYEYFEPHDNIDFLGLTFNDTKVDIHKYSFEKMKSKIKKSCRKARKDMETKGYSYEKVATRVIHAFNHRVYKCYIEDKSKYGWAFYAFRYINTPDTLRKIDYYFRDSLRALKTGKHNKANISKTSDSELASLGYVSMVMMYKLFKTDFDAYCDRVSLLK